MKRFTETSKWDDPWFIDLSAEAKLFWMYLLDKCDNAGVIHLSKRQAEFLINGDKTIEEVYKEIESRIEVLPNKKIFIPGFIEFQFGELSEASNLHKNVILTLKKHDLYTRFFNPKSTLDEPLNKGTGKGKGIGKGYKPPTQEEIAEHIISKEPNLSPEQAKAIAEEIWLFYDSKGWMIGKTKMKSWKSAATKALKWDSVEKLKQQAKPKRTPLEQKAHDRYQKMLDDAKRDKGQL